MCLDSALDLWPPGHFELGFFASRIRRSEMECSALGFSYVRWKPRNEQLAQMGSFHQSKRSDNKQYAVEVRWGIFFLRIWRIFLFLRAVVNIPIQTLIIPPWLLLRKMIISQLELGPPVGQTVKFIPPTVGLTPFAVRNLILRCSTGSHMTIFSKSNYLRLTSCKYEHRGVNLIFSNLEKGHYFALRAK